MSTVSTPKKKVAQGTVKYSGILVEEFPKQQVSDAVYRSGLSQKHKLAIYKEVAQGELSRDHSVIVKRILQAELTGGVYTPDVPGQL